MLRLKALRLMRGWTQKELGAKARLAPSDVSRIESARFQPYPVQLERLAQVLNASSSDALLEQVELSISERASV